MALITGSVRRGTKTPCVHLRWGWFTGDPDWTAPFARKRGPGQLDETWRVEDSPDEVRPTNETQETLLSGNQDWFHTFFTVCGYDPARACLCVRYGIVRPFGPDVSVRWLMSLISSRASESPPAAKSEHAVSFCGSTRCTQTGTTRRQIAPRGSKWPLNL